MTSADDPSGLRRGLHVLIALVLIAGTGLLAYMTTAQAAPASSDGPQIAGVFTDDGALIIPWYRDETGSVRALEDGQTLTTNQLYVTVVVWPEAKVEPGNLKLDFVWATPRDVTHEDAGPNGTRTTRTETVWEENVTLSYTVEAIRGDVRETALEIPSVQGQRLTITYGDDQIARVTHDTNDALLLLPRQTRADAYLSGAQILGLTLLVAFGGNMAARWSMRKMKVVPRVDWPQWILLTLVTGGVGVVIWLHYMEKIVLEGLGTALLVAFIVVWFWSLQIFPANLSRWLFERMTAREDSSSVGTRLYDFLVVGNPNGREVEVVDGTWKGAIRRLLGQKHKLVLPDASQHHYPVEEGTTPYARKYVLKEKDLPEYLEYPPLLRWKQWGWIPYPTLNLREVTLIHVDAAASAFGKGYHEVAMGHKAQFEIGKDWEEDQKRLSQLEAGWETMVVKKGKGIANEWLIAFEAFTQNKSIPDARREFYKRKRLVDVNPRSVPDPDEEDERPDVRREVTPS